ncbi:hypothetical protein WJX73_008183 [Symbiochloris irregularis]|uniref:Uncharacterized protein n=1 Tax=Symbiochloris irregularis TaxID=706552 RepID=A0AAW1PHY6_9CHLO
MASVLQISRVACARQQPQCFSIHKGRLAPRAAPRSQRRSLQICHGIGDDATQGWLDLSKLMSSSRKETKTAYDSLANLIGKDVHVDVNGWHLYLKDITATKGLKLDQVLAAAIGPEVTDSGYPDSDLEELLKKIPLELGKGKTTVSLFDAIPKTGIRNFSNAIKDYARDQK